jgi:hypothetical protein
MAKRMESAARNLELVQNRPQLPLHDFVRTHWPSDLSRTIASSTEYATRNGKDAALGVGYSLIVAENTKQRIWKPQVRAEWERLQREIAARRTLTPGSSKLRCNGLSAG